MSNDWQWNSPNWRQPDEPGSLDNGLGNYPTQQSSGGNSATDPFWNPVSLPPPPPDPLPYSEYGQSGYEQSSGPATPPLFSDYGQSGNPYNQPPGGSYPFAPAPAPVMRSRRRPWFLIPLLLFLVLCVGGAAVSIYAFNAVSSKVQQTAQQLGASTGSSAGPLTITVGAHPTIVIDRNAGAVSIQGVADSQQVVIQPTGDNASLSDGPIMYSKSSPGNTITFDLTNLEAVDVLLKVPAESDLNISTNGDAITVIGVTGQQTLDSNAGNLNASQDTLMGQSTLDTNGGSITFSGSLDPQSTDHFSTNPEPITITLPANANFHADITNNGGVIQSAFPQVVVSDDAASGNVGKAPFAQLEIDSNGGTIQLNKAA